MKKLFLFLFLAAFARAENLYVTPIGAGSTNGTSWANAFAGFSDVAWGSGTGLVGAGDTLYVGAGTYSGGLNIQASGTSTTNRVTIQAAQDTNTGQATINGNIDYRSNSYVTVDGLFGGTAQFVVPAGWATMPGTTDPKLIGCVLQRGSVDASSSRFGEWAYNSVTVDNTSTGNDFGMNFTGANFSSPTSPIPGYGQSSCHHNTIVVAGNASNGTGSDGIRQPQGFDVYNNSIRSTGVSTPNLEHEDLIQNYGTTYARIYNNDFCDSSDSLVGFDRGGGPLQNIWVYNNTFRRTIAGLGTEMLRFYNISNAVPNDVHIDNNTFIDASRTDPNYGSAISFNSPGSVPAATNCSVQNNIFFNCGRGYNVLRSNINQSGWQLTNNLLNAGAHGNTGLEWTLSSTQSAAPSFVSYTEYNINNNLRLTGAGAAVGNGANLSARFTTDKDGNIRTAPWDIGAYESGAVAGPPTLSSATINPAGNQIALVFSQTVQAGAGGSSGWTLNVTPTATLGTMTGVGSNTLTYNLSRVVNLGESVTLTYVQPGDGIEAVTGTADLASITTPQVVTNNSTQGATATPVITLPAGPYFGTQSTTITDSDSGAGAVIHYTVDGSAPTASSPVYSSPISIATNMAIQAIATWTGHLSSAPASSAYEVVSWTTVGTAWKTFQVPQKTGTFTWNLSVTAPAAGSDCVVGLGPSAVSDYPGLACLIQFSGNTINGRAGGAYTTGPAYSPGAVYNLVATINVTAHTWSLTVTPAAGGATTTILTNAAFRTEQAGAAQLSWVGMQAISGTLAVSNMAFPSGPSSARYIGLRGVPAAGGATP